MAKLIRPAHLAHASRKSALPGLSPKAILAVISASFGALLLGAAIYSGLDVLKAQMLRSNVMALANGGQQIAAAQGLYRTDSSGMGATRLDALVPAYMRLEPAAPTSAGGGSWALASDDLAAVALGPPESADVAAVCAEAARQSGFPEAIPGVVTGGKAGGMLGRFGCARDARGGDMLFVYRLSN